MAIDIIFIYVHDIYRFEFWYIWIEEEGGRRAVQYVRMYRRGE